jgi:hypothetical protein
MFEFKGTFNQSQFERFLAFARAQLPLVNARVNHIDAEIARIGIVFFKLDRGVAQGYSARPSGSYLAKLLAAYEVLGGNPLIDLRLRLKTNPVHFVRGDESTGGSQYTSGGEPIGGKGLIDGPTSLLMDQARGWLDDTLHYRFARLERKIRRALDYADQLQEEKQNLVVLQLAASTEGSLEYIAARIQEHLSDPNYRPCYNDQFQGKRDPEGKLVYAKYAAYDIDEPLFPNMGGTRTATSPQKQGSGVYEPGEGGRNT